VVLGYNLLGLLSIAFHDIVTRRLGSDKVNADADNGRKQSLKDERDTPAKIARQSGKPNHGTKHGQTADLETSTEKADHATTQMDRRYLTNILRA
jgi:hypothetical protein